MGNRGPCERCGPPLALLLARLAVFTAWNRIAGVKLHDSLDHALSSEILPLVLVVASSYLDHLKNS